MSGNSADRRAQCPAWCTSTHANVRHSADIAETHLDGMTVTIALAHTVPLDGQPNFGPHTSIEIASDSGEMELDLSPGQVWLLERAFKAEGGLEFFAGALAAVVTALDGGHPG